MEEAPTEPTVELEPTSPYEEYLKTSGAMDSPDLKAAFEAGYEAGKAVSDGGSPELPPDLNR